MPFLSRDWRSPGDQWVRTNEGWERLKLWRIKIFERMNENILARLLRLAVSEYDDTWHKHQPHIHYIKGISKELMFLLLTRNFRYLSGTSQKNIISILEEMTNQALKTETNVPAMKELLNCAVNTLTDGQYSHIGSESLWNKHSVAASRMIAKLDKYRVKQRKTDGKPMFDELPEDCLRCIFRKLSDHNDIIHTGQACQTNHRVSSQMLLWKQLCFFHFTDRQLLVFLPRELGLDEDKIDWKYIYRRCYKRFGMKDIFADHLAICCHCDTLFWQSIGHPCFSDSEVKSRPLLPEAFLDLFLL
ncbi:F-box only protein 25-like isoform X2 [Ostrea edulis]|uniref:F-box only protein 25-like isoform X2 n=1 Tax=Ostrea edulis TaxID=37623 RepID=UPI00209531F5|nr:F-box only protein 25-like isoform X2 [Ostrea edulis]